MKHILTLILLTLLLNRAQTVAAQPGLNVQTRINSKVQTRVQGKVLNNTTKKVAALATKKATIVATNKVAAQTINKAKQPKQDKEPTKQELIEEKQKKKN